jgi:hypothetical protein
MRKINLIVIHCSDSDNPKHDNLATIDSWHKVRGFIRKLIPGDATNKLNKSIGYHYLITKNGSVLPGRDPREIGAHAQNHNSNSIGICLTGKTEFTKEQFISAKQLVTKLLDLYKLETKDVMGHNCLNNGKTCPNFDVNKHIIEGIFQ